MTTKASIHIGHDAQTVQEVAAGIVKILNQKVDQITLMAALDAFRWVVKIENITIASNKFEMRD